MWVTETAGENHKQWRTTVLSRLPLREQKHKSDMELR